MVRAAGRTRPVPPDVTAAWDHIRQLDLRLIAGPLLPDPDLAALAGELLAEVDQRRQLILTSRTFPPRPRRTYDALAAELGVSRGRVRQLEADALTKLEQACAYDRYACFGGAPRRRPYPARRRDTAAAARRRRRDVLDSAPG